jgi:hypothetical protein
MTMRFKRQRPNADLALAIARLIELTQCADIDVAGMAAEELYRRRRDPRTADLVERLVGVQRQAEAGK